jgi:hypothetical protein
MTSTPYTQYAYAEKNYVRSKTSLKFATFFFFVAFVTCVGCAFLLHQVWQEINVSAPDKEVRSFTCSNR